MQEVKIKQVSFINGDYDGESYFIDEKLMEKFKSSMDVEKFKNILISSLKGLSINLNTFEWDLNLIFCTSMHNVRSKKCEMEIQVRIHSPNNCESKRFVLFYNEPERKSNFRINYKSTKESDIPSICNEFLCFLKSAKAFVSVALYRDFDESENYSEVIIKNKKLFFDFVDYLNKEFSYKCNQKLLDSMYVLYIVGEDIRFHSVLVKKEFDYKLALKFLIIDGFIPVKLSPEENNSIFEGDDIQEIINHLKLLLY